MQTPPLSSRLVRVVAVTCVNIKITMLALIVRAKGGLDPNTYAPQPYQPIICYTPSKKWDLIPWTCYYLQSPVGTTEFDNMLGLCCHRKPTYLGKVLERWWNVLEINDSTWMKTRYTWQGCKGSRTAQAGKACKRAEEQQLLKIAMKQKKRKPERE